MTLKVFKAQRLKLRYSLRYGTAVEDRSLLNQSGICDGMICCNIFFSCSYSRFEYKKLHLIWQKYIYYSVLCFDSVKRNLVTAHLFGKYYFHKEKHPPIKTTPR